MVHQGQGLPLGLEPGDHLAGVHARLDDLEGNLALHGLALLGHPDLAHAPFADPFQQLVGADEGAGGFRDGPHRTFGSTGSRSAAAGRRGLVQEAAGSSMGPEQGLDLLAQVGIPAQASSRNAARSLVGGDRPARRRKIVSDCLECRLHGRSSRHCPLYKLCDQTAEEAHRQGKKLSPPARSHRSRSDRAKSQARA